jgi:hypothetical protein
LVTFAPLPSTGEGSLTHVSLPGLNWLAVRLPPVLKPAGTLLISASWASTGAGLGLGDGLGSGDGLGLQSQQAADKVQHHQQEAHAPIYLCRCITHVILDQKILLHLGDAAT